MAKKKRKESKSQYKICRVNDLVRKVSKRREKLSGSELWFRGQADSSWELEPTVLRRWFREKVSESADSPSEIGLESHELEFNQRFRREAACLILPDSNLVDVYFAAQHHGMPTRLLDWSRNALAALFFAVASHSEKDGMVFVLMPNSRMNADKSYDFYPVDVRNEAVVNAVTHLFVESNQNEESPKVVIPVLPDARAGRMNQQGSCFTLHVRGCSAIESRSYKQYLVPNKHKARIQSDLRTLGVTWATLFPDLDHIAQEIKVDYDLFPG